MAAAEDDEYEIPLRDQRYFGSGLKRKRIQFVPSTAATAQSTNLPTTPATSVADRYLSIVLKQSISEEAPSQSPINDAPETAYEERDVAAAVAQCDICRKPVIAQDAQAHHERSITHQICLQHSHPPSHIDRTRKGLNVLENQGWDPDTRLGLGATGSEGRLYPVRAIKNPDKAGLGARLNWKVKVKEKPVKLDAGKARLVEMDGKKEAERLRNAFYRSEEVEKYLGDEQVHAELDLKAFERSRRGR
ncbi:hypothetical protein LTR08_002635 [Meristemomyces frigidus]|nr:hypothetical protein LTR08_002635 [Meristemomyces frigidus]